MLAHAKTAITFAIRLSVLVALVRYSIQNNLTLPEVIGFGVAVGAILGFIIATCEEYLSSRKASRDDKDPS